MTTDKKDEVETMEIPPEIKEIIRQQGIMLETYNLIMKRWSCPALIYKIKGVE